ncbi:MAG: MBL fold metallo-hydrolase [Patescibacteria group bacterium]
MIITYHGVQSFRVQFGDTVLAFDPVSKNSENKATNFGADIALVSINHRDMNGAEQASRGEKQVFGVRGPGEYEISGVFIKGVASISNYLGANLNNTIYRVSLENMNLCFLGALSDAKLSTEAKESLDGIDILFVPVDTLGPSEAYKLAVSLEPSIIIPMNFTPASLKTFLKEGGDEGAKPIEKLTIKKKDLEGKEGEIIILEQQ